MTPLEFPEIPGNVDVMERPYGYTVCLSSELHKRSLPHPHIDADGIYFDTRDRTEPMIVATGCGACGVEVLSEKHDPHLHPDADEWLAFESALIAKSSNHGYRAFFEHVREKHPDRLGDWLPPEVLERLI